MIRVRTAALTVFAIATAVPAIASGTIGYGSRAGMEVDVVAMSGIDTDHSIIRTKHTRQNAIAFCREYVGKVTADCIRQELAVPLNDQVTANCTRGEFTDFQGGRYRFAGPSRDKNSMAKYTVISLPSGEIADGSMASGYPVNIMIFRALCPTRAPGDY